MLTGDDQGVSNTSMLLCFGIYLRILIKKYSEGMTVSPLIIRSN